MKEQIGCKDLPEASSATSEEVLALFKAKSELYFTQKELAENFEKSNPCINKILRKLVESKLISRKKVSSRYFFKLC